MGSETISWAVEKVVGQWHPLLPQSPPQSFFSLQGFEFSVSLSEHEFSPFSFCPSFLQQLSLPPQARAVLVGATAKASISKMEVKSFILVCNVFLLDFVLGGFAAQKKQFVLYLFCYVWFFIFIALNYCTPATHD